MIYSVHYDLKKVGQDYSGLYEALRNCGAAWWHHLDSTWLLDTHLTADGIWNRLSSHVDENDLMLIVNIGSDYAGWLPPDAWKWLNERRSKMAA